MASRPTRWHVDVSDSRVRKCVSQKIGFPSYERAHNAAESMMDAGKVSPGCHITPYLCDECGDWHVRNRLIVFRR